MAKKKKSGKKKTGGKKKTSSRNISIEKQVLKYLKGGTKKEYSRKEVFRHLGNKASKERLSEALDRLGSRKLITFTEEGTFRVNQSARSVKRVVQGIVDMTQSGSAYIITPDLENDVYVPNKHINQALNGDTVTVALYKTKGRPEGEIIEIVKRSQTQFIGTLEVSKDFAFLIPDSMNMTTDIFIPIKDIGKAKDKDKVIVEMTEWEKGRKNPNGKVVELLGHAGDNDIEMKSILLQNGFNLTFPKAALQEMEKIPESISQQEIDKRMDYRKVLTFTIDPDDAKDFDDALSIQKLDNGNWEVGVHIADVSHYIRRGSALDKEALFRATSVYLPDRVCPMFPERISNIICSLRPEEEKLCFAAIFEFDAKYNIKNFSIGRTVIFSDRRFTYNEAQERLESREGEYAEELHQLNLIAHKLRKDKFANGAIAFESEEVKFVLDEKGHPVDVYTKERKDAHMLVEDFMLLANKTVTKYAAKLKVGQQPRPFVYRVHDKPDAEKLSQFAELAKRFGHHLKFDDNAEQIAATLNDFLKKVKGRKEQHIMEQLGIRSMAKASYTTKNIGHYGLAFEYYTHFTSPIRRYPDVMVHRLLEEIITDQKPGLTQQELEEKCKHSSAQERAALVAEREAIKYKQVEFMKDRLGEEYDGIISGVIQKGIFVELEANKCEGMISQDNLGMEDFMYDESKYLLVGLATGRRFQLGDKVRVKVINASLEYRKIDFELVEPEED